MTDKEAIKLFQSKCALCKVRATCESMVAEGKSPCLNLNAISALQEREERSNVCEFCQTTDFHTITKFIWEGKEYGGVKYCPMCGRPLKGADNG